MSFVSLKEKPATAGYCGDNLNAASTGSYKVLALSLFRLSLRLLLFRQNRLALLALRGVSAVVGRKIKLDLALIVNVNVDSTAGQQLAE